VALEATFRGLLIRLQRAGDGLQVLRLTLGDKPLKSEAALVDHLENGVLDIMGLLQEAIQSACEALNAVGYPVDLDRARRALIECQNCFHRLEHQFSTDLVSYEKLKDLEMLGNQRRGEWFLWAKSTKDGITGCCHPLTEVSQALVACWQELAEHLGTVSISVQASSIGQQIAPRKVMSRGVIREEVT
jgi:hypothetical protein